MRANTPFDLLAGDAVLTRARTWALPRAQPDRECPNEEIFVFDVMALGASIVNGRRKYDERKSFVSAAIADLTALLTTLLLPPPGPCPPPPVAQRTLIFLFERCGRYRPPDVRNDNFNAELACVYMDAIEAVMAKDFVTGGAGRLVILLVGVLPDDIDSDYRCPRYTHHVHENQSHVEGLWSKSEDRQPIAPSAIDPLNNIIEFRLDGEGIGDGRLRFRRFLWKGPHQFACQANYRAQERIPAILHWHLRRHLSPEALKDVPPLGLLLSGKRVFVDAIPYRARMQWSLLKYLFFNLYTGGGDAGGAAAFHVACGEREVIDLQRLQDPDACDRMERLFLLTTWLECCNVSHKALRLANEAMTPFAARFMQTRPDERVVGRTMYRVDGREFNANVWVPLIETERLVTMTQTIVQSLATPEDPEPPTDALNYAVRCHRRFVHHPFTGLVLPSYDDYKTLARDMRHVLLDAMLCAYV